MDLSGNVMAVVGVLEASGETEALVDRVEGRPAGMAAAAVDPVRPVDLLVIPV
jgi:hypothetical protein